MKLLTTDQYYNNLLNAVTHAKVRIVLAGMVIYADDKTMPILDQIKFAARRGVRVHIYVYSGFRHMLIGDNPYSLLKHRQTLTKTLDVFARLRQAGVQIVELRDVGLNPFKGRCHVKAAVADDQIFSFGGINFTGNAFKSTDYMLYKTNAKVADVVVKMLAELLIDQKGDTKYIIDNKNSIFLDNGQPGQSIIYDHACELAKNAKKVYYISQMVPSGRLASAIKATNSVCYFNRPNQGKGLIVASLIVDKARAKVTNHYKRKKYLHAKFMLFEMQDGGKALISGSHNLSWRGVVYGTQEIAIYSTDEDLWAQLYDFAKQNVF